MTQVLKTGGMDRRSDPPSGFRCDHQALEGIEFTALDGALDPLAIDMAKADRLIAIGSINSPMQCMMKEICAQCLQRHRDPRTGAERIIFSCFNQDQDLDHVDFENLNKRLNQNATQEKLTGLWIDHALARRVGEGA
jgi:hypothetical protein